MVTYLQTIRQHGDATVVKSDLPTERHGRAFCQTGNWIQFPFGDFLHEDWGMAPGASASTPRVYVLGNLLGQLILGFCRYPCFESKQLQCSGVSIVAIVQPTPGVGFELCCPSTSTLHFGFSTCLWENLVLDFCIVMRRKKTQLNASNI